MPFSQVHDAWIRRGLVDATFTLHVLPCGNGSWGRVEDLPVDVYFCDFEEYDPPEGFPKRDICCVRTEAAWWVILAEPVFQHVQQLVLDGELTLGLVGTVTVLNERQIGAWILVRDKALTAGEALCHMDQFLFQKYGQDYASVKAILDAEPSEYLKDLQFDEQDFGKEPLEGDALEVGDLVLEQVSDRKGRAAERRGWVKCFGPVLRWFDVNHWVKLAGVLVLLTLLGVECPRLWRLSVDVYGPSTLELESCFPKIRWVDRTSESVMSASQVSRSLFQALSHRNPFKVAGSIVEVSVRDIQNADESPAYRWKIMTDDTGTQEEITAQMSHLSGKEMRDLQNALSGYKNLKFILAFKLFMAWGHNGRFIVIFTGLCLGVVGLLIRRVVRRVQGIQGDMAVRDVSAGSKILEAVAQDGQAAENLMRFNQARRLRMVDEGAAPSWEKETFDWVDRHIDPDTGKTRRRKRDDRLAQRREGHRL